MRLGDLLTEATAAVTQRPLRTLLTALGTILGVGAFVATTGLAQTASAQVSSRFDALLATEVRLFDASPDGTKPFPDDVDELLQALNGVNHAGLMYTIDDNGDLDPRTIASRPTGALGQPVPVIAATPGAIHASRPTISAGRIYDAWHQGRGERVALLGAAAAGQLGITRLDQLPVVFLGDTAYSIVGIIDDVARNPEILLAVVIPTNTAAKQFDVRGVEPQVVIDTAPGAAQLIGRQAPLALRPQDPGRLQVLVPPDPQTLRLQVESDVQTLFYALAGLALLVGAVAIANATLLNVIERRPEIGLRRALGATRGHITRQIIIEAAQTGTIAGVLGTTIGILAVAATAVARQWTPIIDPAILLAAPVIGIATGAAAGTLPALNAARTPPADTLRT
jgi:putative ABC transport system permease protein